MVIWLTGLSGVGKTTISRALYAQLKPRVPSLVVVDGDAIRQLFDGSLGFHEEARREQIGRVQRLARFLADQGVDVIVAALYCHPELMAWNRANLRDYFEIYVEAPLALVCERDVKGLYAKAATGAMPNVVGIDIPWHKPEHPDMVIDMTRPSSPDELALRIVRAIPRFTASGIGSSLTAGGRP